MRLTIAVDFDDTIKAYESGWMARSGTGIPLPGAAETIASWQPEYEVVVCTCRTDLSDVTRWLDSHGIHVDDVINTKPIAAVYIDDRAVHFTDWASAKAITDQRLGSADMRALQKRLG